MARKARYTAQLSFTCLPEHKEYVTQAAAAAEISQADVARDLFTEAIAARNAPRHVSDDPQATPIRLSSPVVG
jgi:hypothetical protein